jgi:dihydroorotate dehydrogenase electron transfer subunit
MSEAGMRTFRLQRVVEHSPGLKSFYFDVPFEAQPGQFVMLWIPGADEKPFSISDLRDGCLELSVKAVGRFTHRLMEIQPGARLGLRGPFGSGFRLHDRSILVGGGCGFAPLRFLARRLGELGLAHRIAIGVRSRSDLMFAAEYTPCALTSQDGSVGVAGLVTEVVEPMLDAEPAQMLYAAGPEPMLLALRALARRRGVSLQASLERYMKCGFGLCGQCCLDGAGLRVCVEGPVFDERQLDQVTELGLAHRTASGRRPVREVENP